MAAPLSHQDRQRHARVGEAQEPRLGLPHGVGQRDEMAFDLPFEERHIEPSQHLRGREPLRGQAAGQAAQDAADHGAVKRRRSPFAAHITDDEDVAVLAVGQEIIEVAAQLARGLKTGADLEALNDRAQGGHDVHLDFARAFEVPLQARFAANHALVEPGVFDGHGDLRCQRRKNADMFVREVAQPGTFHIHDADHPVAIDQRHGHFGARLGIHHDVTRVFRDVGHHDGLSRLGRRAHNALPERHGVPVRHALVPLDRDDRVERLRALLGQEDAEPVVVDQAFGQRADFAQQFIQHQDRTQLAADFVQQLQRLRLADAAPEERGVLNRRRDATGQELEQVLVLLGEEIGPG